MSDSRVVSQLEELFRETGPAHHAAFRATDGHDPEWPLWYADYVQDRVSALAGRDVTKSDLTWLIICAEKARGDGDGEWPAFYAQYLAERL
jgi:hypothetical protein